MTSKEKFYLLENQVIYKTKEYQKECKFVNLKTNERIECQQLVSDIEKDLEKLEKLEKVIEIIKPHLYFHKLTEKMSFLDYAIDAKDNKEEFDLLKEVFNNDDR